MSEQKDIRLLQIARNVRSLNDYKFNEKELIFLIKCLNQLSATIEVKREEFGSMVGTVTLSGAFSSHH